MVENSVVDPENGEKVEKRRPESRSAVDDTSKGMRFYCNFNSVTY